MSNCGQACPYNTLNGCKVKEYNAICPLSNMASIQTSRPRSNADRIRAMSDEELAEDICDVLMCVQCPALCLCNSTDGKANGLKKWLQQPCEEGEAHE